MKTILIILSLYLLICAVLFYLQDRLLFFPPTPQVDLYESVSQNAISLNTKNEKLHGWNIKGNADAGKTIIYFGGNAEDVVYLNFEAAEFKINQLIAFNYPGYGNSTGKPSQKKLYDAALHIYDWAVKKYNLNSDEIIVMGRSLGSSVAAYLGANREISGLILITPFDSIESIAAKQYKFFPVTLLLKHPFPTIQYISQVKVPTLMLAAEQDEIISKQNLNNLKQKAGKSNELIRYPGVGHNNIQTHRNYYADIERFIESL